MDRQQAYENRHSQANTNFSESSSAEKGSSVHKLAIFDMDGTLFDTARAHYMAYNEALHNHGFDMSWDYYRRKGFERPYPVFLAPIVGDDPALIEEIHDEKVPLYPKYFDLTRKNEPLFALLRELKDSGYYIAMGTTAPHRIAEALLKHTGDLALFDLIVGGDDVPNCKPDPDVFLAAMEHFGVAPEDTLVFEDTMPALEEVRKTGAEGVHIEIEPK